VPGSAVIDALLLGTSGMMPLPDRWLSALLIRSRGELILFDCGEGTQIPMRSFGWGFRRLSAICLSHWHADHVAGLPGLLHTVANSGRTEPLLITGPVETIRVVDGLRAIAPVLPYRVDVVELTGDETFPLPGGLTASVLKGVHHVPSLMYRVDLSRAPRFLPEQARELGVPTNQWSALQNGEAIEVEGQVVRPEDVLGPPRPGISLGYMTDTRPVPAAPHFFRDVDLLVSEGTYGDPAFEEKAIQNTHMTFGEAATIAKAANAGLLWLTHFSPSLADPEADRRFAAEIFPDTVIGWSGLTTTLRFRD
jgi:ribonuclease Z